MAGEQAGLGISKFRSFFERENKDFYLFRKIDTEFQMVFKNKHDLTQLHHGGSPSLVAGRDERRSRLMFDIWGVDAYFGGQNIRPTDHDGRT
jgi:hypothetical protein